MSPSRIGRWIVLAVALLGSLAMVRPVVAAQYTINFEDASSVPTSSTPSPLDISNTFGAAYVGDLVHGVLFDNNFSVYSKKYTNNVGGSDIYGPTNGTFALTNTAGGGTADTGPANPGLNGLTFMTGDVLQSVSFAASDYGNGSFGVDSVTVTAFGGSGDLAAVSLSLMDASSNPVTTLTSLNTSTAFNPFAGVITGYRINRTVTSDYAMFNGGGNYVADDFVFNTVPTMSSVAFNPSTVTGATTTTGTLVLTGPAPSVNAVVHLTSSNSAALSVPPTAQITAGYAYRSITATSHAITTATNVTVTATYNGVSKTTTVTVNPMPIVMSSVAFNPSTVVSGDSTTGTLVLTGPAPAANAVVSLTSSNTAAFSVPPTAQIGSGFAYRSITATARTVTTTTTVTVTATYNGVSKTTTVTVMPPTKMGSISFSPSTVAGATTTTGTLTLSGPAPAANAVVSMTSSNTAALTVPPTAQLNAGLTSRTFTATSKNVTVATTVTVTATYNGVSKTATVTVTPPPVVMSSVAFSPSTVTGGATTTGTLVLTGPAPAANAVVSLTSSNTAALSVPPTAQIASGYAYRSITATSHSVATATTVTVTATYNGVSKTTTVTVTP